MPDALELLMTRSSIKPAALLGPGPSDADIEVMLTAASRVPDHGKLTPWRFLVFEGDGRLAAGERIASRFCIEHPSASAEQLEFERLRLARAPLVIAVISCATSHPKIPKWEQILSAGAAAMNLILAAHALGYAADWMTEWYAYDASILEAFGLNQHERIVGFVHIGRADMTHPNQPRPAIKAIATRYRASEMST